MNYVSYCFGFYFMQEYNTRFRDSTTNIISYRY